jgi:hypothetical protein
MTSEANRIPEGQDLAGEIPATGPANVPERVIEELLTACRTAADFSQAFNDACKAQAEKYKVKPKALQRYVKAIAGDKVDDTQAETDDLAALIDSRRGRE